jgi:two-component system chemotaxis response regulator CheB
MSQAISVLVVDDSSVVRRRLSETLEQDEGIRVAGTAPDAYVARDKVIELEPDVLTLDLEMPRMNGITFLGKLMKHHPLPVIVISAHTQQGAQTTIKALELGAVDVMSKPSFAGGEDGEQFGIQLRDKVKAAARARRRPRIPAGAAPAPAARLTRTATRIVAIGASTGGTESLSHVLQRLPGNGPPILIVQHMPQGFTAAFAERLNTLSAMEVLEAADGMAVQPGRAIVAAGDKHMLLRGRSGAHHVQVKDGPLVCRHRPSVEVLFDSVTRSAGKNAIGVLMTGMGRDGAEGLLRLREAGAATIAQDEDSCVVFGMPKEAIRLNAARQIVPLDRIADTVLSLV